jgi:hypothetical protein
LSATSGATRCSGPTTSPLPRATRVTVADSTRIESGKATGASWCEEKIIPRCIAQPVGEMLLPRSGPRTELRCQSPQ